MIEPNEPDGLRTLRSMAALAGRLIVSARSGALNEVIEAAYFPIEDETIIRAWTSCWHWSRRDGLRQFTGEEMEQKQWVEGYHYYAEKVWEALIQRHIHEKQRMMYELAAKAMELQVVTAAVALPLLHAGLARR